MKELAMPILPNLKHLIELALEEDIGEGDITTEATVSSDAIGTAVINTKEPLVIAGLEIAKTVFALLDTDVSWNSLATDGAECPAGMRIVKLDGKLASLLKGERVALNFLQHLSGIATITRSFVKTAQGTGVKILDTRKTLPGYRALEKYAVRVGGGENHRMGLYDRYLIKENHITASGGLMQAMKRVQEQKKPEVLIEVEVKTLKDVEIAVQHGADIIMLDNMDRSELRRAVRLVDGRCKLEVSGNITRRNLSQYINAGINYISVGALTHSARAVDIHMLIV